MTKKKNVYLIKSVKTLLLSRFFFFSKGAIQESDLNTRRNIPTFLHQIDKVWKSLIQKLKGVKSNKVATKCYMNLRLILTPRFRT